MANQGLAFWCAIKLVTLALKMKFGGKIFSIKLHPQCSAWKEHLLVLVLGREHVLPRSFDLHGAKVKILIVDYPTSLCKFVFFQHCLRIQ